MPINVVPFKYGRLFAFELCTTNILSKIVNFCGVSFVFLGLCEY